MPSFSLRQTLRRSSTLDRQAEALSSTRGCDGGSSIATEASDRGEYGKDCWVPYGGKAPLFRWFLARVVPSAASSVGSSLSGWVKSSVGRASVSISSSATLCICWSSWVRPSSSGMLAELVGKFSGDMAYSELPLLSPELAANMTSLSGSAGILGVLVGPSVGRARFEFIVPLLMSTGVAVSGAASVWTARAAPARAGNAGHPAPLVRTGGVNTGTSG